MIGENFEGLFEAVKELTSIRFASTNQRLQVSQGDPSLALVRARARLPARAR